MGSGKRQYGLGERNERRRLGKRVAVRAGGLRGGGRCLLVIAVACGAIAAPVAADASPTPSDYTWTGAASNMNWSSANWATASPVPGQSLGTVTFPALAGCSSTTCWASNNDISELSANALSITDNVGYDFHGDQLAIGSGGLTAAPAGTTASETIVQMPLELAADQTWAITGVPAADGNNFFETVDGITGSSALNLQLGTNAYFTAASLLAGSGIEVGSFAATGANSADTGLNAWGNGALQVDDLNGVNEHPVSLTDVVLEDDPNQNGNLPHILTIGPLTATGANLAIGDGNSPDAILQVNGSVTLNTANETILTIDGAGATPATDYSQLRASGNVQLGGELQVDQGGGCGSFGAGSTATLITTTGTLSGTFTNAPADTLMPMVDCNGSDQLAAVINYTANSVTATTVAGATTQTNLTANPAAAAPGQSVTLTAQVHSGTYLNAGPTGTVGFYDNGTAISGCSAQPVTATDAATSSATCTTSLAATGSTPDALTAVYTPTSSLGVNGSTSPALELSVGGSANAGTGGAANGGGGSGGSGDAASGDGSGGGGGGGANASSGPPSVSGSVLSIPISCSGSSACTVQIVLTVQETLEGNRVTAVAARTAKPRRRTVRIGSATVRITGGAHRTVTMRLNAAGRSLLAKRHELPAALVVTQKSASGTRKLVSRKLTFRRGKKRR